MKRDLMIDAITCIDDSYLEQYARYEAQMLRKKRVGFKALLISAACLVLVFALLLCSLPLTYIVFREPINNTMSEVVDHVMFPQSGDEDGNRSEALWVHWPLTDTLFDVLGAGGENSIIEAMKQGSGGLVGDLSADLGTFLDRMYQYYLKNDLSDETIGEIMQGTETERVEDTIPPDVTIPEGIPEITSIHGVMLYLHFNEQTESFEYWIHAMNGTWGEIYIPGEYKGIPVTIINEGAFKGHKQLKTVRMSDNITTIGNSAFEKCTSLESVEFPAELQSIGERAFAGCHALNSVEISSDKLQEIGKQAFENCSALQRLSIPDGPVSIGDYAFAYCSALEEIEMAQVTSIGDGAFKKCVQLKKIELPRSLAEIGQDSFATCESLRTVAFSDDGALTTIGPSAFANCFALKSIEIPEGVKIIGNSAFYYCTSLEKVVLPGTVEVIDAGAFFECSKLQSVIMEDGDPENCELTICMQAFMGCKSLSEIRLPNTLRSIETEAFYSIWGITELTLPENLENIHEMAIYYCINLETITITNPNTVYAKNAIFSCPKLQTIIYCDTQENWFKVSSGFSLASGTWVQCTDGTVVIG